MRKGKNTITFYTKEGLFLGTYECDKYISHARRKEFAKQLELEDWHHYTIEDAPYGLTKEYETPPLPPKYDRKPIEVEWSVVDEKTGKIIEDPTASASYLKIWDNLRRSKKE